MDISNVLTKNSKDVFLKTIFYIFLAGIVAIFLFPFLWMLGSSLRPHAEIFKYTYPLSINTFVPIDFTLQNFHDILFEMDFGLYLYNSIFVSVVMIFFSTFVNSIAAYAIQRMDFLGKRYLYVLILFTMLVPLEATLVPTYMVVRNIGLFDTLWAMIVPWIAEPFGIFLLVQHMKTIPTSLDDAAEIDGCGFLQTYWYIIMPNIKPSLITLGIMKFVWAWNAFTWPLVATESNSKMLIQVAIATLTTRESTAWGYTFASSVLATLPVLILFLFAQKYFMQGSALSGMKG